MPRVSATAATPQLLIARWVMFVSVMSAIGLMVLRLLVARPLIKRVPSSSLRPVSVALAISSVIGLIAIPVYLDFSTANDSLRSVFDVGALVPLFRVTAFGRAIVDFELCFALFCVAAWIAVWVDRPDREQRSVAGLVAVTGALIAAAAVLIVPGLAGHAAQTSPRGLMLLFDWVHLISGSVWMGGLLGLLVIWRTAPKVQRVRGAVGGGPALLERRAGVGDPAGRDRGRRGDHPHARRQRAMGDRIRPGAAGQGRAADRRAGRWPRATCCEPSPS